MSSPTTEVKPSQVAQLMKENEKLKAENENLYKKGLYIFGKSIRLLEDIESHPDYEDHWDMKNEEYKDTITDLQGELEEEKKKNSEFNAKYDKLKMDIKESHLENEKLKEEIEILKRKECLNLRDTLKIKLEDEEKIEKLKEENYVLLSFQKEVDQMEAGLSEIDEDYEDMRYYDLPDIIKTLKEEICNLNKETKMWRLSGIVQREFLDPKGYYTNIEDYKAFDEYIKDHYPEEYEDLYEFFDIELNLDEDEDE